MDSGSSTNNDNSGEWADQEAGTPIPDWCDDAKLQQYCQQIVLCLMAYGDLTEVEAQKRLDESGLCAPENTRTVESRGALFHEVPYYWAMGLLQKHGDPMHPWWHDSQLWPPPAELNDPNWPDTILKRKRSK